MLCHVYEGRLNFFKSQKLKPPFSFNSYIPFHSHQWMPLRLLLFPHKNFAIICSNSPQKDLGSKKHIIEYMGIACKIAFIKTSFPP